MLGRLKVSNMRKLSIFTIVGVTLASSIASALGAQSDWVHPGPDGKLIYKTTDTGDRIMDFSHAGYMGGGVALPTVAVKRTVKPSGGPDDTALIQAACVADMSNLIKLSLGFPGYASAVHVWRHEPGGDHYIRALVEEDR